MSLTEKEVIQNRKYLDELPAVLDNLNRGIEIDKQMLSEIQSQMKEMENEFNYDIKYMTDPTSTAGTAKLYKDDSAREKALKDKKATTPVYQELVEQQKKIKSKVFNLELDFFALDKKFKAVRAKTEVIAAEMNLKADLHLPFDKE